MVYRSALGYLSTALVGCFNIILGFQICRSVVDINVPILMRQEYVCEAPKWAVYLTLWSLYSNLLAAYTIFTSKPLIPFGPFRWFLACTRFRNASYEFTVKCGWAQNLLLLCVYAGLLLWPWEGGLRIKNWWDRL